MLCREFSLVLEAQDIEYEAWEDESHEGGDGWVLSVAPAAAHRAYEEIDRYCAERRVPRGTPVPVEPFAGAGVGAAGYVAILVLTAYCAGDRLFGVDWLSQGALDPGAAREWWRALTALTLHLDQEHLLGNLLFGAVAGIAAGRLLGPGVAWASILGAGALANYLEILIAPAAHRAVGASTAVFAALGLLAGLAWRQNLSLRERRWRAAAPLVAGICLLTLLGAGNAHVDVLGHVLGFIVGVATGWIYARSDVPRNRGRRLQIAAAAGAVAAICAAWLLALSRAA